MACSAILSDTPGQRQLCLAQYTALILRRIWRKDLNQLRRIKTKIGPSLEIFLIY